MKFLLTLVICSGLEGVGRDRVNDGLIHIKFYCTPLLEEKPGTQT